MGYFRQFDDLGIISVNPWYVLDLGILPHEKDGTDTTRHQDCYDRHRGRRGFLLQYTDTPPVGFPQWKSAMGKIVSWDVEKAKNVLCQDCLDKLLAVMETYGPEGEEPKAQRSLPGGIFRRWSCIPCREQYISYYIRDYYVRMDQTDGGMEVEAVYAPERK